MNAQAALTQLGPCQEKCKTASRGIPRTCGCTHVSSGRRRIPTAAAWRTEGRSTLEAHGVPWPAELDHAVARHCDSELGAG